MLTANEVSITAHRVPSLDIQALLILVQASLHIFLDTVSISSLFKNNIFRLPAEMGVR